MPAPFCGVATESVPQRSHSQKKERTPTPYMYVHQTLYPPTYPALAGGRGGHHTIWVSPPSDLRARATRCRRPTPWGRPEGRGTTPSTLAVRSSGPNTQAHLAGRMSEAGCRMPPRTAATAAREYKIKTTHTPGSGQQRIPVQGQNRTEPSTERALSRRGRPR